MRDFRLKSGKLKGAKKFLSLFQTWLNACLGNMIGYDKKNLSMGQQMYQSKTLVLDASTRKASMYRRVEDHHFDFSPYSADFSSYSK